MKCIYAIPRDASMDAKRLAQQYTAALSALADNVIALGDDLRAFAETHGAAVLKLDDDDWANATSELTEPDERRLAGKLFWSPSEAQSLQRALDGVPEVMVRRTVAAWLGSQAGRERSFLLLAT